MQASMSDFTERRQREVQTVFSHGRVITSQVVGKAGGVYIAAMGVKGRAA